MEFAFGFLGSGDQTNYWTHGYKLDEVRTKDPVEVNTTVKVRRFLTRKNHVPIARSLGPRVLNYSPPMADPLDQATVYQGALYRFCRRHVVPDPKLLEELGQFVENFCHLYLNPIDPEKISYEKYLENSHYSKAQKDKFLEIHRNQIGCPLNIKNLSYKSFGKVETMNTTVNDYEELFKDVRCINGPPDEWKVYSSAYVSAVEHEVCKLKYFAKYVPVVDRARVMHERLSKLPGPYYVTDYTSFESSFVPAVVQKIECILYNHMLKRIPEMARNICRQITGKHSCRFRDFTINVDGIRMSGDPNTSLGNGFSNLMLMLFNASKQGASLDGFVEGDDGLFAFDRQVEFDLIGKLGFQLKLEPHDTLYTTSFCGMMLSQSLAQFADPRYVLTKFGWTSSQLRMTKKKSVLLGLLRAKALSLFYTNPRCPILTQLAIRYIQLTEKVTPRFGISYWEQLLAKEVVSNEASARAEYAKGISLQDRLDFENLYGVCPKQQEEIEKYLESSGLGPLDDPSIDDMMQVRRNFRLFDELFCGPLPR